MIDLPGGLEIVVGWIVCGVVFWRFLVYVDDHWHD